MRARGIVAGVVAVLAASRTPVAAATVEEPPADRSHRVQAVRLGGTKDRAQSAALTLRLDTPFTQAQYDASRAGLERYYQQAGYAYVRVDKAATVDTVTDRATVTYTITRGIPAVFGTTSVSGTDTTSED